MMTKFFWRRQKTFLMEYKWYTKKWISEFYQWMILSQWNAAIFVSRNEHEFFMCFDFLPYIYQNIEPCCLLKCNNIVEIANVSFLHGSTKSSPLKKKKWCDARSSMCKKKSGVFCSAHASHQFYQQARAWHKFFRVAWAWSFVHARREWNLTNIRKKKNFVASNSSKDESCTCLRVSLLCCLWSNNPQRAQGRVQATRMDLGSIQIGLWCLHVGLSSGVN